MTRTPQDVATARIAPADADGPLPAALLEHRGGPSGPHYDLLLAVRADAGPDDLACATWRVDADPAEVPPGATLRVERIHDHRAEYLDLPAPRTLDGGRGTVEPRRRGTWREAPGGSIDLRFGTGDVARFAPAGDRAWTRIPS